MYELKRHYDRDPFTKECDVLRIVRMVDWYIVSGVCLKKGVLRKDVLN